MASLVQSFRENFQTAEEVCNFKYLGSVLVHNCSLDPDLDNRLHAAHFSFGRLAKLKWVFYNRDLTTSTKLMVYNAVIIPTLL